MRFRLRTLLIVFLLLTLSCAATCRVLSSNWWHGGAAPIRFDSDGWKHPATYTNRCTTRSSMVEDLLSQKKLYGLTSSELLELLGPPDKGAAMEFPEADEVYFVGMERAGAFSLDYEYLLLKYDANG